MYLTPGNVADFFFDGDVPALFVSAAGRDAAFPMPDLPRYHERLVPGGGDVFEKVGGREGYRKVSGDRCTPIPLLDAWRLPLPVTAENPDLSKDFPVDLEVDGFLPYVVFEQDVVPGGMRTNPVLLAELHADDAHESLVLAGMNPALGRGGIAGKAAVEFRWLDKPDLPAEWTMSFKGRHALVAEVKDKGVRREYEIEQGQEIAIEGTDYRLKIDMLTPEWPLMTPGFENARSPVAQISVTTPAKRYQRTVIDRYPQLSQDIDEAGKRHREGPYDPNLVLTYRDCAAHSFCIAAGPDLSPVLVHTAPGGARSVQKISTGQTIDAAGVSLTIKDLILKPRMDSRPVVIPVAFRQRGLAPRSVSAIRVLVRSKKSDWRQHVWVPFTQYGVASAGDRRAVSVEVPDYAPVELVYGRRRNPFGGKLALERMKVEFNPGRMSVRDWTSYFRMSDERGIRAAHVYLNHTAKFHGWTLFQSSAPSDQSEDWTVLGVGNRRGMVTMTVGCILITLGLMYAFYVKPIIKRRLKERYAMQASERTTHVGGGGNGSPAGSGASSAAHAKAGAVWLLTAAIAGLGAVPALAQTSPGMPDDDVHRGMRMPEQEESDDASPASEQAAAPVSPEEGCRQSDEAVRTLKEMTAKLDLTPFRLMAVQHNNVYQTGEAWAHAVIRAVTGSARFEGIDPVAWALELSFNAQAHIDRNMIYVKDLGLRHDITSHPVEVDKAERERIWKTGLVSFRFLRDPKVRSVIDNMKQYVMLKRATDRVDGAQGYFTRAAGTLRIVPDPAGTRDTPWHTVEDLIPNLRVPGHEHEDQTPVEGISTETARMLMSHYFSLSQAWSGRDADGVNRALAALAADMPRLAPTGIYPSERQRSLEVKYYQWDALVTAGWVVYMLALMASIFAVASQWRGARWVAIVLFTAAVAIHGTGLGVRWYIMGRIPVANMFESVVASAFIGVVLALALEWRLLHWAQTVWLLPITGAVWLCIESHSALWIPLSALGGAGLLVHMAWHRLRVARSDADWHPAGAAPARSETLLPRGIFAVAGSFLGFLALTIMALASDTVSSEIANVQAILDTVLLRIHTVLIIASYAVVTLAFGVSNVYLVARAWKQGSRLAWGTLGCEILVGLYLLFLLYIMPEWMGARLRTATQSWPAVIGGLVRGDASYAWFGVLIACCVGGFGGASLSRLRARAAGTLAEGLQWDGVTLSRRGDDTPAMRGLDQAQMIFMNMANIGLFVGMILGAWWADHSWGRPWGWDPKEVFALTTWLIYAILIHVRYVVRDKGQWTAVVGVIGFAMMMFNWWAVNFFIVGLHSYA